MIKKITPMMKQYLEIKNQYPNYFVFYRLGDFYEMFFDDALKASQILKLTLTRRNKNSDNEVPMVGLPHHAADGYIAKLINEGYSVVICDQVGEVNVGKIVERKVTRIITPSTVSEETLVDPTSEIKLCSVVKLYSKFALVQLNVTNGDFQFITTKDSNKIIDKLESGNYAEILYYQDLDKEIKKAIENKKGSNEIDECFFKVEENENLLVNRFLIDKKIIAKNEFKAVIAAAGSIVKYIEYTQKNTLPYIKNLIQEDDLENIVIDSITVKNLELIKNSDGEIKKTLFTTMNETSTSLGARKLKDWIQHPSKNEEEINERLNNVEKLIKCNKYQELSEMMLSIPDIERISTRIALKTAKPMDLRSLRMALENYNEIKYFLIKNKLFSNLLKDEKDLSSVLILLKNALVEKPSQLLKDGNVIKSGYNKKLDELRNTHEEASDILLDLEEKERKNTSIDKLKIVFNKIDGFYISVPNSKINLIPTCYILKKELKNEKRYTIPQLKTIEEKLLTANSKSIEKEKELYFKLLEELFSDLVDINELANMLSIIDVLNSFALLAKKNKYNKPEIGKEHFNIIDGRHPVIEKYTDELFIPNDFIFDDKNLIMLTGSNMGGKSTYMRQNALIIIMAQMGSFVPAKKAEIKKIDRIFTRIGSGDNLSDGLSTFMVEMKETANILKNATKNSFVLIDEIGRGTSTYDGLSLAWTFADELSSICKTIFSTHYFELTELEKENKKIVNMHMKSIKYKNDVIFLHKIEKGAVFQSYGIEVAQKAGIEKRLIEKAKTKLLSLKAEENTVKKEENTVKKEENKIEKIIKEIDIDSLSPLSALKKLYELQIRVNNEMEKK